MLSRQTLARALLRTALGEFGAARCLGEFVSVSDVVAAGHASDLLIVDCDTCPLSAREAEKLIRSHCMRRVIFITDVSGGYHLHVLLRYGFHGLLHKRDTVEEFRAGLAAVLRGNFYVSAQVDARERFYFARVLSEREVEVMRVMVLQPGIKNAAKSLAMSAATLRTHRRNVFAKLEIKSQTELIAFAARVGLVSLDEVGNLMRRAEIMSIDRIDRRQHRNGESATTGLRRMGSG
ncbi:MAG: response regulator transcription factor [Candidatus Didemnitutus sp.]|nr:response regulator transcription factor [Candidatus Didemnitutus sp.]